MRLAVIRLATAVVFLLGAAPLAADAQQPGKTPLVGVLNPFAAPEDSQSIQALRRGLRELGYVEGQSVILEYRSAGGRTETLPDLARQLAQLKVDVLYTVGPAALRAARDASGTIPIVATDLETDPVAIGYARSLARPGGHITGMFLDLPHLAGKWLEMLREVAPAIRRVAFLWDATTSPTQMTAAKAAARGLGMDLQVVEIRSSADVDGSLTTAVKGGAKALVLLSSPIVFVNSNRIAGFMTKHHLPGISPFRDFADAGGLMSYGPNLPAFFQRAAIFVDKILKGAKPGDLPIEQPTKFELVINAKTAKALGLKIPASVLARADQVIE